MGGGRFDWEILRLFIIIGILTALAAIGYGIFMLVRWLWWVI
jgi:uncharacterized membrane protein YphA (DoxX/SURF4 family)